MSIKTTILINWMPDYFPSQDYVERYYLENEEVRLASENSIILTSDAWEDIRFNDYNQQKIQSSTQEKYQIKFSTTETVNVDLLERAGRVLITPQDGDSYYVYNVNLQDDYREEIRTFVYTMTYTKDNVLNYATYLASDNVKDYADASPSENFINKIEYVLRKPAYVQRVAIQNNSELYAGDMYEYNIVFERDDSNSFINLFDRFYAKIGVGYDETDMRIQCVNVTSREIWFRFESFPVTTLPESEITISSEPGGQTLWNSSYDLENSITDSIYTFLYSKGDEEFDLGTTNEQIQGLEQYQRQKFKNIRSSLVYLRPTEVYKIHNLMNCLPSDISLIERRRNGEYTYYYPVTNEGIVNKNVRNELKGLLEYQINIKYNNLVVNVNR